jgi:hypothetical protein
MVDDTRGSQDKLRDVIITDVDDDDDDDDDNNNNNNNLLKYIFISILTVI